MIPTGCETVERWLHSVEKTLPLGQQENSSGPDDPQTLPLRHRPAAPLIHEKKLHRALAGQGDGLRLPSVEDGVKVSCRGQVRSYEPSGLQRIGQRFCPGPIFGEPKLGGDGIGNENVLHQIAKKRQKPRPCQTDQRPGVRDGRAHGYGSTSPANSSGG